MSNGVVYGTVDPTTGVYTIPAFMGVDPVTQTAQYAFNNPITIPTGGLEGPGLFGNIASSIGMGLFTSILGKTLGGFMRDVPWGTQEQADALLEEWLRNNPTMPDGSSRERSAVEAPSSPGYVQDDMGYYRNTNDPNDYGYYVLSGNTPILVTPPLVPVSKPTVGGGGGSPAGGGGEPSGGGATGGDLNQTVTQETWTPKDWNIPINVWLENNPDATEEEMRQVAAQYGVPNDIVEQVIAENFPVSLEPDPTLTGGNGTFDGVGGEQTGLDFEHPWIYSNGKFTHVVTGEVINASPGVTYEEGGRYSGPSSTNIGDTGGGAGQTTGGVQVGVTVTGNNNVTGQNTQVANTANTGQATVNTGTANTGGIATTGTTGGTGTTVGTAPVGSITLPDIIATIDTGTTGGATGTGNGTGTGTGTGGGNGNGTGRGTGAGGGLLGLSQPKTSELLFPELFTLRKDFTVLNNLLSYMPRGMLS